MAKTTKRSARGGQVPQGAQMPQDEAVSQGAQMAQDIAKAQLKTFSPGVEMAPGGLKSFVDEHPTLAYQLLSSICNDMARLIEENADDTQVAGNADPRLLSDCKMILEQYVARALAYSKLETQGLQSMSSLAPRWHTMPNNALMNTLQTKPAINTGAFDLVVANPRGRGKEITAYTMVTYTDEEESGVSITDAKLTEYERQVSDAIVSLWLEAAKKELPPVFTTDSIFRAMPGGGDKPSAGQKSAITRTIERLRRIHITVDATEEMRKRGVIKDGDTMCFDDYYLSATRAAYKVKNGGQTVQAYKINSEPIVLSYCRLTNQLLTVSAKCLAIQKVKKGKPSGENIAMTPDRQAMTGYLLRRIAVMKRDKRNKKASQSTTILFDSIFADIQMANQSRDKAFDNRKFCYDVLNYEVAVGYIKGFKELHKGRKITGVQIVL